MAIGTGQLLADTLARIRCLDRTRKLVLALSVPAVLSFLGLGLLVIRLATPVFPLPPGGLVKEGTEAEDALLTFLTPELADGPTETSLPPLPKSLSTETYTVRSGDSIGGIAARFGLKVDSLVSLNAIASAKALRAGTELKIPNMNGTLYRVGRGESLSSIASRNGTTVSALADANDLGSSVLSPGQAIFIPGGRLAPADLKRIFGEYIAWPARGTISSYFGYRPDPFTGVKRFHGGIDLAVPEGTPVRAIMDGRVADLGYNNLFGNYIIVNHADGMQSLYGHLSKDLMHDGQRVVQGDILGYSGNTGYSTAPHLHFGLYRNGTSVNPLKYLK